MKPVCAILFLLSLSASVAFSELRVDAMFSDHMVLQRELSVPIWGTASPGDNIEVQFAGQKKTVKADAEGAWMLRLGEVKVHAEGRTLQVKAGEQQVEFVDVLVGDVWLGSGQSNMAGGTRNYKKNDAVLAKNAAGGPYPNLRLYKGDWKVADQTTIDAFSAIHFSFGLALYQELDIPIGLMVGAVGGTPSGRWMTDDMAAADSALLKMLKEKSGYDGIDAMNAARVQKKADYALEVKKAKAAKKKPARFKGPIPLGDLYARHIAYMVPYGMRGVLWDQGESKTQIPGVDQYTTMHALINGWRSVWGQGDFHFLHVQKPSGGGCAWDPENPINKGAEKFAPLPNSHVSDPETLEYPLIHIKMGTLHNAPLVPVSDLAPGVHPRTKSSYGARACRVALGTVYGKDVAVSGPVYTSHRVEGKTLRVKFDYVGSGLAYKHGGALQGFEIAGADGNWVWADAKIEGDSVVLSSDDVAEPKQVQYAFSKSHRYANLFNKDGLPALMFTTVPK